MNFKNSLHCPPNFFLIVRVIFCVMCVNYEIEFFSDFFSMIFYVMCPSIG